MQTFKNELDFTRGTGISPTVMLSLHDIDDIAKFCMRLFTVSDGNTVFPH
jgi:ABC-type uncharacterized transport system ATPase subunit